MKVLFALMLVSTAALADDAALLKCRQLEDGPLRLSCYNAIPLGVPTAAPAVAAGVAGASAAPAAAAAPTQADLVQSFGREADAARLQSIETSIVGEFDGWVPNQRIRLANGQVWRVVDGSDLPVSLVNPKVKLERGAIGAIYMDIEGAKISPRVKREK
jgi:hypothetical protein